MDSVGSAATVALVLSVQSHARPARPARIAPAPKPRPLCAPDRVERAECEPANAQLAHRAKAAAGQRIVRAAAATSIVRDVGGTYPSLDLGAIEKGGIGQPHTLQRHVGKSDAQLRERLATERVPAASTYDTLACAQRSTDFIIGERENQAKIGSWLEGGAPGTQLLDGTIPGEPVGRVMSRKDAAAGRGAVKTSDAQVVLKADPSSPTGYTVLSSYPTKP